MSSPEPKRRVIDPRLAAALIIERVLAGASLSEAAPPRLDSLVRSNDRGLAQELSYGVMRWRFRLGALLRILVKKPLKAKDQDIFALLLLGLYQLIYLRTAEHAAVHATASAARAQGKTWAVALINGVLREFQRRRDELLATVDEHPANRYAMPPWLLERIQRRWPESWTECVTALNSYPPMSLRVNRRATTREDYKKVLQAAGSKAQAIPATESGLILERAMDVMALPGFAQGQVSVQDGGAQLAAELLAVEPGQRVLDACAAPGGKTGHILELAQPLELTALDINQDRLERVAENLSRLNISAHLAVGDAAQPTGDWAEHPYDRILLDVPCSATGVIRRHPDIKSLRRESDIPILCRTQAAILRAVWPLLSPGGQLLYATCSLLPEENEEQVMAFLEETPDASPLPLPETWGEACSVGRQIVPGAQNMDGFYYARLAKVAR